MGIFKLFELNIGNTYLLFYNVIYMLDGSDCLDILNQELTLGGLAEFIYNNYDNLEALLPRLDVRCFYLMQPNTRLENFTPYESYTRIDFDSSMIVTTGETSRWTVISKGTEILLQKYNGIFSNLLTFMYFFVEYTKKNKTKYPDFSFNTFIPDSDCINYIKEFIPLDIPKGLDVLLWYAPNRPINNNIFDHINTGISGFPHFFISSLKKKEIFSVYKKKAEEIARENNNTSLKVFPVKIVFKLDKDNPAIFTPSSGEKDYVLSPFIKQEYFTIFYKNAKIENNNIRQLFVPLEYSTEREDSDEDEEVNCNDRDNHNYRDRDNCDDEQPINTRRDEGGGRMRKKKYKIKKTKKQKTKKLKTKKLKINKIKKQKIKKQKTKKIKKIKTKNNKKKY